MSALDQPFPTPPRGHRDWYAWEALRAIPRLVLMADKNPFSKTYGCFDRSFWHYRTMDFPCGMNQEFVLPLALAHKLDMPGNAYKGSERLRELAIAGIDYAIRSSHRDGTCDDYFPFERALGALVFSLYAMTESAIELDVRDPRHLEFFARRGDWLRTHNESGQLANHQAFAALALYNVYILTGERRFAEASDAFRDLTLSWQKDEGWFQEYEGADPGYHSCTIAFLGKLWQKSKDERLLEPMGRAIDFAWHFMHPDGSYAGEYGSRNTFHFYPHGFEVFAWKYPKAGQIAETFLRRAMPERRRYFNDDDRMAAHYVYDWMQAWRDHAGGEREAIELPRRTETKWFPQAGLLVVRTPRYHAVVAATKGGTFKVFDADGPVAGDTGLIGELDDGTVAVTHIVDRANGIEKSADDRELVASGRFQVRKHHLPTPFKQVLFRLMLLTIGRFDADRVRRILQKILITGKRPLGLRWRRRLRFADDAIEIVDEVILPRAEKRRFRRLAAGTDATSIYVANSNVFQESTLLPWTWFDGAVEKLNRTRRARMVRRIDLR